MEFFNDRGPIQLVSKYDGEVYLADEYSLEEAYSFEIKKRKKLESEGYDVDKYEKLHNQLTMEYLDKFPKMKNIFEISDLYDEYEQKKKNLAKEFFGIELKEVVMY